MSQTGTQWFRMDTYHQKSIDDYVISANKVENDVWRFCVYGPAIKVQQKGGVMYYQDQPYKEQYNKGEQVLPPYDYETQLARQLIGCFEELKQAKQACDDHKEKQCQ